MSIPPRARFYAMLCAQVGGSVIIASGMGCYWFGLKGATVPRDITWRTGTLTGLVFLMGFLPLMGSIGFRGILKGLARKKAAPQLPRADRPGFVRVLVWVYCFCDLALLTYLVHITGGISGSMFAGVYVAIPAIALILIDDLLDVKIVAFLILLAILGVFLAYLMSSLPFIEGFKANQSEKAFDISLAFVTAEAMLIPLIQIAILWYQLEDTESL
jgi:hypothetical protein